MLSVFGALIACVRAVLRLLGPTQRCLTFEVGVRKKAATKPFHFVCPALPECRSHSEHRAVMPPSYNSFGVLASSRPAWPLPAEPNPTGQVGMFIFAAVPRHQIINIVA